MYTGAHPAYGTANDPGGCTMRGDPLAPREDTGPNMAPPSDDDRRDPVDPEDLPDLPGLAESLNEP